MLKTVNVNKKYFTKLDLYRIPSPSYVIDTKLRYKFGLLFGKTYILKRSLLKGT